MSLWSPADLPHERLKHLAGLRTSYEVPALRLADLPETPGRGFAQWFAAAEQAGVIEPNAMTLATAGEDGVPTARTVLLKSVTAGGFVFFTNTQSRKGRQLAAHPRASLLFAWLQVFRQISITGQVARIADTEADEYFAARPRGSQIAAWASEQSQPLTSRAELVRAWGRSEARFSGLEVPRPPQWGGYEVRPYRMEFWQGQPSRMHDRVEYSAAGARPAALDDRSAWQRVRLSP